MPISITGLRVLIGRKADGSADYPDFNTLAVVQASGSDWSVFVDSSGLGWHYDHTSGHDDDDPPDSPIGTQLGVLLVPTSFASQAVTTFGAVCTRLNEVQTEAFYNTRAHVHEPDNLRDEQELRAITDEKALVEDEVIRGVPGADARRTALRAEQRKALDPADSTLGIRTNHNKTWALLKVRRGIVFDARAIP